MASGRRGAARASDVDDIVAMIPVLDHGAEAAEVHAELLDEVRSHRYRCSPASRESTRLPAMIELAAVNVGVPAPLAEVRGDNVWSGIRKHPVPSNATLWLSTINLSGDGQADLSVHGGVDKAVYAYPSEHLGWWEHELDEVLGPAPFGENLSTVGVLEGDVRIGDVWAWGDARLQVSQPRAPCFKLAIHRGRPDIQARFRRSGRTGWYLRVLDPGEVPAAGPIELVHTDAREVTVADAHHAMADVHRDDDDLLRNVADHPLLAEQWRVPLLDRLAR